MVGSDRAAKGIWYDGGVDLLDQRYEICEEGAAVRAVMYDRFAGPITIRTVPDPTPPPAGVVVAVQASGLCRSDWHGWQGHDPSIVLPHVPGHELAGEVVAVGSAAHNWRVGDRVTVPFVLGCGRCASCAAGQQQVCADQFQPGFTHWGSFADYVALDRADGNLVRLPDDLDVVTAASLGCRFATAFRAIVDQGAVRAGQWVAVHGCGGVGLSAIMLAHALGAQVVAVDVTDEKLAHARALGAHAVVNATTGDVVDQIRDITAGGAHVSLDALGSPQTCFNSIANLRTRGIHVQVGLLLGDQRHPPLPMDQVIAQELQIRGSHGMQAHRYDAMLALIRSGAVQPHKLVGRTIELDAVPQALADLATASAPGVTVMAAPGFAPRAA